MVRVYRYIVALCLVMTGVTAVFASDYPDISILSSSKSGITFVYRPTSFSWATGSIGFVPKIPNTTLDIRDGVPAIAGRIVYIAIPSGTRSIDAEVTALGSIERKEAPSPASVKSHEVNYPYPDSRVRVDGIHAMHGVRMARLILHPATIVAPDGSVDFADEMTVSLRIDADESVPETTPLLREPFAGVVDQILLNPEDARVSVAPRAAKVATDLNPFAGGGQWVAIRTRGDGVHTVSAGALTLAGINTASVNPADVRLFAGPGRQLSTRVTDAPPPLSETPIHWQDDGDAVLESGEQFVFWADGLNRWDVDSLGRLIDVVHRYDRDNVYWLTLNHSAPEAPKRLENFPAPPISGAVDFFNGIDRARHEEDNMFRVASSGFVESYYAWYWRNQREGVITFFNSRNAEPGRPAQIDMGTWAGTAADFHPRLSINGTTAFPQSVRERQGEDRSTLSSFTLESFDPANDHELYFDPTAYYYLDFYTIEYSRRLDLSQGPFKFAAPDTTLDVNFTIANASSANLWDVSDPHSPVEVVDVVREGSSLRFGASLSKGNRRVFYVFNTSSQRVPRSIAPVALVDIHSPATGADYLAIGPRLFAQPMADFLGYRAGADALQTRFVAVEDVYNSFSLGLQDPLAIRRFLKHTHTDWPNNGPLYCLLVGDGTNDFLDNTGTGSINFVPPYITRDEAAVSDESFIYFSDKPVLDAEGNTQDNPLPDMLIGRWPVKTSADIAAITAKIKRYESAENLGQWRSQVMMVADDEFGDRSTGSVREGFHIDDAESISNTHIPSRFDVQKIYLTEYPFENPSCYEPAAAGCRKPTANDAIMAGLNEGVLVFDYLGHGNPDLLAHERVFERQVDLPRLANGQTPAVFFGFSCSIGFFDSPQSEGMSEELLRMPTGGAVAVVSATRVSGAFQNASFNEVVFDLLFQRGILGVGAALYTSKLLRQYNDPLCRFTNFCEEVPCPCNNDRGYVIFGDPAMRIGAPELRVDFNSVTPDSLSALTPTQVTGRITDTSGLIQPGFDGTLFVTVRDVPRQRVYPIDDAPSIDYELAGGTLYRGQVPINDGQFTFTFIVPKDIAYGQSGAVIMGHAVSTTSMANGAVDSLRLAGSPSTIDDTVGPTVRLETAGGELIVDGFRLNQNAVISLIIEDPSGINLTGSSGHRLEVFTAGSETPLADLTDEFVYNPGAADKGSAQFTVAGLGEGAHRLTVKAWDNANNSSSRVYEVQVVANEVYTGFALTEFLNHPNPFDEITTFYFRATRSVREARIRLFTLAGRMIWEAQASDGMTTWDGRDIDGDQVANGVYLAQLEAVGEVLSEGGQFVDKKAYREMKVVVSR